MRKLYVFTVILAVCIATACKAQLANPPIEIPFTLKEPGYVTMVIEDHNGMRVRNLISETWFKAGENKVGWDGLDDLGRDPEAAHHGVYHIPSKLVAPGKYTVKALVHDEIKTSYEFSVDASGSPTWDTDDHKGGWLANHSQPQSAVFVPGKQSPTGKPAVFLGTFVTEGRDGLAWVDLDGNKQGGRAWIGGVWTVAPFMARDAGEQAAANISVYVASVWETAKLSGQVELRISSLPNSTKPMVVLPLGAINPIRDMAGEIGGFAIRNGIAVVSLVEKNELMLVDVKEKKAVGTIPVTKPQGLAFDSKGGLLVISGNQVFHYSNIDHLDANCKLVINKGLDTPIGLTTDSADHIYVSTAGASNQVKVFTKEGTLIRTIGHPGVPKAGVYDSLHMNNPMGMTIDSRQQLWVTEHDYLPKRVSVWSLDGKLLKTFYGPAKYGGGGTLDPVDKTKFYYAEENKGMLEFNLDWQQGSFKLAKVLYRKIPGDLDLANMSAVPETPIYYKGKRYFTDCYNSNPVSGQLTTYLFMEHNGLIQPAVAMGQVSTWDVLKNPEFKSLLPAGTDFSPNSRNRSVFFIWTDLNLNGKVEPNEVKFEKRATGGITVMADLSFCIAQFDGKAVQFSPGSFTADGLPVYDMAQAKILATGVLPPASSGGNQVLVSNDGWSIITQGVTPFDPYSLSGVKDGKAMWSYPDPWPGLHASHEAPLPDFPGELIGTTRVLGGIFGSARSEGGALWAINSNHGMVYIFTTDGLFVTTLFEPMRAGKLWKMPVAQRGMSLKGISLNEENFWPTITQTADGNVYMVDGGRTSLVKVDGLNSIRRLAPLTIVVSLDDLKKSSAYQIKTESLRQQNLNNSPLQVRLSNTPIAMDTKWGGWKEADWVNIDKRGIKAYTGSGSKPYDVTAAVTIANDRLYAGYRTGDVALLKNSNEMPNAPFKTGGALDLMIGTDLAADPKRSSPVMGDLRILVTLRNGKPYALLYRAVVTGAKQTDKVPFSSPWRTVTFDQVEDISASLEFSAGQDGSYEFSVPLSLLKLKPVAGQSIKGDVGILRGDGAQTVTRVYWNNKATGIVSDVPSEAELTPNLWGTWDFVNP
ncbi:hypothetical protein [Pedobacter sp. L105]|uniref:hypothetical protein n=1 Tax=Pedobacter sp. L105 TaxID=1641871 RepID=UPI00131EB259|nr:hypothetical protein [Pedobacter sp. L105]